MSRADSPVQFTGQHGAGLYGGRDVSHKTACPNSNNPFGHSPHCPCRRASQSVPYSEALDGVDRDGDAYLGWADDALAAEMDRQMGADI